MRVGNGKLDLRQHASPQVFNCRDTKVTFDSRDWIGRFDAALEDVVDSAADVMGSRSASTPRSR